jgi:DNA-binding HxlR family transcriptional regulator
MIAGNIVRLSEYRWNTPVLAHLHQHAAASFVTLTEALEVSRDALSRSLHALLEPKWIAVREGARREYKLTRTGGNIAPACSQILEIAGASDLQDLALRRWTLPIAAALTNWSLHFGELKAMLPGITPRALTLALKDMQAAGLIEREVIGGFPPSTSYKLTDKGAAFLPPIQIIK